MACCLPPAAGGVFMPRFMPQPPHLGNPPGTALAPPWYGFCLIIRGNSQRARHEGHPRQAGTAPRAGPPGRRAGAHRGAAQARQADRPRARRAAARQGLVRGVRHVRRAPLQRLRHGEDQDPRRRRGHRLGHRERPHRVPVRQGFHRVRRLALRNPRAEDHQGAGRRHEGAGADHRPVRRRRRAHPGGRRFARRLRRGVQAQRHRLGRHPADQRHHGPVRRRRRLFAGDDRLHLHGARHELHVRHRPRRGEDRDQRGGDGRGAWRRQHPHHEILDLRRRLRRRRAVPVADAPADRLPAVELRGRRAGMADATTTSSARIFRSTRSCPTTRTSPTTSAS